MGGRVLCEYPFISAVGADVSPYTYHTMDECGVAVFAAEQARIIDEDELLPADDAVFDVTAWHARGVTGKGVGVAVIDTGIVPHLDFCMPRMRLTAFVDFVENRAFAYDDNGHGTQVAGIACASGLFSPSACGVAPCAHLVALKAVDKTGSGNVLGILSAMQWLYTHFRALGVRVVNLSLGSAPLGSRDPLSLAARALVGAGLTVVASAGNAGPNGDTIQSPGICKQVLTVGGASYENGKWTAAPFSSRGTILRNKSDTETAAPASSRGMIARNTSDMEFAAPASSRGTIARNTPDTEFAAPASSRGTDNRYKPDLIAPAVRLSTTAADGAYTHMSGTSAAAPLVSGVCALILQQNPARTPLAVKERVLSLLQTLDCPRTVCGAGLLRPFADPNEK